MTSRREQLPATIPPVGIAHERYLLFALLLLGAGLRLRVAMADRSLWHDEAALAVNVVERDWNSLNKPLWYSQVAPLGFLYIEKAAGAAFGFGEVALRLAPCLAGILLLPLIYQLARSMAGPMTALIALFLVAIDRRAIGFSGELKPYSGDALLAALILLAAWNVYHVPGNGRSLVMLAVAGVLAAWCSLPSAFVLSSVGLVLIVAFAWEKVWRATRWLNCIGLLWGGMLAVHYQVCLRGARHDSYLQFYWTREHAFMPFPPRSWQDVIWLPNEVRRLFDFVIKPGFPEVGLTLAIAGCLMLWRARPFALILLLAPLAPTLIASACHAYPFDGRLLLFLTAPLVLLVSLPIARLLGDRRRGLKCLGIILLVAASVENVGEAIHGFCIPPSREEVRPVLGQIASAAKPGDLICLPFETIPAYRYYAPRMGLAGWPVREMLDPMDKAKVAEAIRDLAGAPRVWFVFSRTGRLDEKTVLVVADRTGRRVAGFTSHGSAAYLYTFVK